MSQLPIHKTGTLQGRRTSHTLRTYFGQQLSFVVLQHSISLNLREHIKSYCPCCYGTEGSLATGRCLGFFHNTIKHKETQKLDILFHHVNPCLSELPESPLEVKILYGNLAFEIPSNQYFKSFFIVIHHHHHHHGGIPLAFENGIKVSGDS